MATVRTLLMLLGALSVLLLGTAAPVMAETGPPPCHTMAGMSDMDHGSPASTPELPMNSMACCVACIATPSLMGPPRSIVPVAGTRPIAIDRALPTGLRTTPETGPPKT